MPTPRVFEAEFVLKWRLGARPACLVAHTAARFEARVAIPHAGLVFDAKEILGVMLPAGAPIKLVVTGPDAEQAMNALRELFTVGEPVLRCAEPKCAGSPVLTGFNDAEIFYSCSEFHYWSAPRRPVPAGLAAARIPEPAAGSPRTPR